MLTLVIIGAVAVGAAAGFALLLRWPSPEATAESDEDQQGVPPIVDVV